MSISTHTAGASLCFFIVFVIGVAALIDWQKAWTERVERRLSDDLWRFPKSYRALLKDCGVFFTDETVQKYLKEIISLPSDLHTCSAFVKLKKKQKLQLIMLRRNLFCWTTQK